MQPICQSPRWTAGLSQDCNNLGQQGFGIQSKRLKTDDSTQPDVVFGVFITIQNEFAFTCRLVCKLIIRPLTAALATLL